MSSAACLQKISEFQDLKNELVGIIDGISGYISECNGISTYLEDLIVNEEPIDKEQLSNMSSSLENIKGIFQTMEKECIQKIEEYRVLYEQAIERENQMKKMMHKKEEKFEYEIN